MSGSFPHYSQLPSGDAAGVFGRDDVLGCLNHLTAERVVAAARHVMTGEVFSLNAPLDWPNPPLFNRGAVKHTVFRTARGNLDDKLDNFFAQSSSQWDAFPHVRDPELGFYNRKDPSHLGIDEWARRGIAGRAVLLDVARWRGSQGRPLRWTEKDTISVSDLEGCSSAQGVKIQAGDIMLIRTGWMSGYQNATEAQRHAIAQTRPPGPGLISSEDMAARLWDWQVSAIAADNPGLEATPVADNPLLHSHLLSRLGIPIGELWLLDELASACAADGRYEFLLTSAPLNVVGGIGSPANALAIR